jgi:hypothetical protein
VLAAGFKVKVAKAPVFEFFAKVLNANLEEAEQKIKALQVDNSCKSSYLSSVYSLHDIIILHCT